MHEDTNHDCKSVLPRKHSLQLLSCNILAGGSIKHYRQYFTHSLTHVLPTSRKRTNLDELARIIAEFDLVGLQEADAGSLRSGFLNQTQYLAEVAGFPYWSHQPNRKIGQFAASSNGMLSRIEPVEVVDSIFMHAKLTKCSAKTKLIILINQFIYLRAAS